MSVIATVEPGASAATWRSVAAIASVPHVDVGHGWLIFALPAAEVALHPADEPSDEAL